MTRCPRRCSPFGSAAITSPRPPLAHEMGEARGALCAGEGSGGHRRTLYWTANKLVWARCELLPLYHSEPLVLLRPVLLGLQVEAHRSERAGATRSPDRPVLDHGAHSAPTMTTFMTLGPASGSLGAGACSRSSSQSSNALRHHLCRPLIAQAHWAWQQAQRRSQASCWSLIGHLHCTLCATQVEAGHPGWKPVEACDSVHTSLLQRAGANGSPDRSAPHAPGVATVRAWAQARPPLAPQPAAASAVLAGLWASAAGA